MSSFHLHDEGWNCRRYGIRTGESISHCSITQYLGVFSLFSSLLISVGYIHDTRVCIHRFIDSNLQSFQRVTLFAVVVVMIGMQLKVRNCDHKAVELVVILLVECFFIGDTNTIPFTAGISVRRPYTTTEITLPPDRTSTDEPRCCRQAPSPHLLNIQYPSLTFDPEREVLSSLRCQSTSDMLPSSFTDLNSRRTSALEHGGFGG